jgi:hypothetical protein
MEADAGHDGAVQRFRVNFAATAIVLGRAMDELTTLLRLHACRYESWPFDRALPRVNPDCVAFPPAEPGAGRPDTWLPSDGTELAVTALDLPLGRFVLIPRRFTTGVAFTPRSRERALAIATECAEVLVRDVPWAETA